MGLIQATIRLANPRDASKAPMDVNALVDTGALHLCVPEHVVLQLDLQELYKREVTTADGKKHVVPYVGPIEVRFGNRACFTGALVFGTEVLLGAVPMEDMDLVIIPSTRTLAVNPENPNMAVSVIKSAHSPPVAPTPPAASPRSPRC